MYGLYQSWQVDCLEAMGYQVYKLRTDEQPEPEIETETDEADTATPAPRSIRALPPSSPLERELLMATGQTRRTEARAILDRLGVNSAELFGNPQAKRELWLKLRTLRPKRR